MVRYFHMYPLGPSMFVQKNPGCLAVVKGRLIPYMRQKRNFAKKDKDPQGPTKEEQMTINMPGFVHPETMKEEGYFTQKAKKQIEELKRKAEDPTTVQSPERKL
ncbi:hypothetical protein ABMA28_003361 [Loxostege sticticalis]|uniref:Uncharacterized protein n=1 Tax=Loxostege sticticalis TaxID=481309 RepID=A0ABD0SVU6_LOXSC